MREKTLDGFEVEQLVRSAKDGGVAAAAEA
jgi:hypothetical protein